MTTQQINHHVSGPQYWRSLEQLAESPEVLAAIELEFPGYDPAEIRGLSRRRFMKLMAASMALAGVGLNGCPALAGKPPGPNDVNLRDCTIVGSNVLPFRVRAMIGLKGSGDRAEMDHGMTNGRRALFMRTKFGCNAGAANYLGSLVVQKPVKVGNRMVWRNAVTRARVRATRIDLHSICAVEHTWTVPANVTRSTQLRYTWSIKSTGIQPAAKAWTRTSKAFTVQRAG